MNYDERISFLKEWFKSDIARRFNMPRDLEPTVVAMDIIEAINRNLPSKITKERMSSLVAPIAKEVTQSAKTRTVPSVKEFMDAMSRVSKSHAEPRTDTSDTLPDSYQLNADRIRSGVPVAEMYLRGKHRKKLIEEHNITEEDLHPYDEWVANTAHTQ